ncbi:hypothetical protein [Bacillus sp. B4EP4a]|uniref:hypothetical protein n=1 Tax=Bacillus sp. B4EP4a TaxID=2590665 RepID=UPI00115323CA|nr:hypothetical protein [Bacillus sp. B4EP4a]
MQDQTVWGLKQKKEKLMTGAFLNRLLQSAFSVFHIHHDRYEGIKMALTPAFLIQLVFHIDHTYIGNIISCSSTILSYSSFTIYLQVAR